CTPSTSRPRLHQRPPPTPLPASSPPGAVSAHWRTKSFIAIWEAVMISSTRLQGHPDPRGDHAVALPLEAIGSIDEGLFHVHLERLRYFPVQAVGVALHPDPGPKGPGREREGLDRKGAHHLLARGGFELVAKIVGVEAHHRRSVQILEDDVGAGIHHIAAEPKGHFDHRGPKGGEGGAVGSSDAQP